MTYPSVVPAVFFFFFILYLILETFLVRIEIRSLYYNIDWLYIKKVYIHYCSSRFDSQYIIVIRMRIIISSSVDWIFSLCFFFFFIIFYSAAEGVSRKRELINFLAWTRPLKAPKPVVLTCSLNGSYFIMHYKSS